jgi:3D (Asp-Asp-Asp) domain-containing protein
LRFQWLGTVVTAAVIIVGIAHASQVDVATGGHGKQQNQESTKVEEIGARSAPEAKEAENGVRTEKVIKRTPIKFKIEYQLTRSLGAGRMKQAQAGKDGVTETTFEVQVKNGRVIGKKLIDSKKIPPTNSVVQIGAAGYKTSRGTWTRTKVMTMEATAYDPSAGLKHPTFTTATGLRAQYGVVAVDPRVIPLGTKVFVEGYGFAIAADTGGAIKGNRIDLCMATNAMCRQFGRRKVKVHILSPK